eukprot:3089792-Rhodomonas_salina.2
MVLICASSVWCNAECGTDLADGATDHVEFVGRRRYVLRMILCDVRYHNNVCCCAVCSTTTPYDPTLFSTELAYAPT